MPNGPRSFIHTKVYRPITTSRLNNIQWHGSCEQIEVPRGWTIPRECSECQNLVALSTSRYNIVITKPTIGGVWAIPQWTQRQYSRSDIVGRLACPGEALENIWIAGTAGKSSMFRWNDEWWIIYGTRQRKKQDDKVIILHKPMAEFNLKKLEKARVELIKTIATWRTE